MLRGMKPFLISFGVVVVLGGVVMGAMIVHSQQASSAPVGYRGNGVTTYNSATEPPSPSPLSGADRALASMPDPSGTGPTDSRQDGSNPKQKIISSTSKDYQDDSLDEQVQEEKNESRPVQSNQPK
jgi:hypothetical protein